MSLKVMTRVWDRFPYGSSRMVVALAIADYASDSGVAWPSVPTLAEKARISDRQIIRITRRLQAEGELAIHPRWNPKTSSPTSNAYIVLTGSNRKTVRRACFEIMDLGGSPDRLSGVSDILYQRATDNLSGPSCRGRQDPPDNGDTTLLTGMSHDPSLNRQLTVNDPSAEDGADWLSETRIEGESDLESMSPEERAKVASPAAQAAPEDPGDPTWKTMMRRDLEGITLPGDYVASDVINFCQRFWDRTGNPPPAYYKGSKAWRLGAVEAMSSFHGSLITLYEGKGQPLPPIERQRRLLNLCVDIFFEYNVEYAHITASTPRALTNSMAGLISNAGEVFDYFGLTGHVWPGNGHVESWVQFKEAERNATTKGKDRGRQAPRDNGQVRGPSESDQDLAGRLVAGGGDDA